MASGKRSPILVAGVWTEMLRPIIEIDDEKCDGCGQCITDCAEGALEIVNGKARLVSESYCDGLGACLNCPQGVLKLSIKEAPAFDEKAAMQALEAKKATTHKLASLKPLGKDRENMLPAEVPSWPIQLALLTPQAQFLNGANVSLCAQCAGFALPDIHDKYVKGHIPIIACPKLEDNEKLIEKLANALKGKDIKTFSLVCMSVPCCKRLEYIAQEALKKADIKLPIDESVVSLS